MIKQEIIERVRMETDIVELIGSYIPLKKVGRYYRGLCPFHPERSPSFYVSPERQTYHCFGCGAGGNAFGFVMAQEKLAFPEAVRFLASRLGIKVIEHLSGRNRIIYEACENAAQFFERRLRSSESARRYLKQRGLRSETVKRFRLGFAPPGNLLRGEARKKSWSEDGLVRAGLLVKRDTGLTDYFYDRLMFPIFSVSGRVIGFGGRVLGDREPKYLNSPDTEIFHKGNILYGAFQAKGYIREQIPLLVEGNFDVLSLVDRGVNNTLAPLGTALTSKQALLIRRYNHRVLVCFDGDVAGRKAARHVLEVLLSCGLEPQVVVLPEELDPDDYIKRDGKSGFLKFISHPQGVIEFVLAGREFRSVSDERAALRELVALLRLVNDETTRELYANRLADRFKVDKSSLIREASEKVSSRLKPRSTRGLEEKLLAAAVQDAALARIARDFCIADALTDEKLQAVARIAEKYCDEQDFGPALLLDKIEDENMRKMVAGWTFVEGSLPDATKFTMWMRRLRAAWVQRRIIAAHENGKEQEAEILRERSELLKEATQERSSRL